MTNKESIDALKDSTKSNLIEAEGVQLRVKPVSAMLLQEITSHIPDPQPPLLPNPDKDNRLEPNPFDPAYMSGLREAQSRRNLATSDALIMFGLELVDGLPKDETWLIKLKKLEKMGLIDLTGIDFDDPFEKEFAFKKFIAGTTPAIMEVTKASGVSQEDVDAAIATFPGNATQ